MSSNRHSTSYTLKIIGLLMAYPEAELQEHAGDFLPVLKQEGWLPGKTLKQVEGLIENITSRDLLDLQSEYVAVFDRTPSLSLHLFEHVHGDSRDRGQALVELDLIYREAGLHNASEHTPDYLPLFLEYLSLLPLAEARDNLDGVIDIIAILGARATRRNSPHACLFDALQSAASRKPNARKIAAAMELASGAVPGKAEMDAAWEEQFAFEMNAAEANGQSGCPKAADMLARMQGDMPDRETRQ